MIDAYLKSDVAMEDHVIHLLFSANRWEAAAQISSLLAAGTTILCDRFHLSGIAYSAAKRNPSLPLPWAAAPERGLPRPDLVLFLDLDERAARARGGFGDERYERAAMQARVRDIFCAMAAGADEEPSESLPSAGDAGGAGVAGGSADPPPAGTGAAAVAESTSPPQQQQRQQHTPRRTGEHILVVDAGASVEAVADEIWRRVEARVRQVDAGELGASVGVVE
ncbi:dTMP kinase [Purpureocillium takamizusanense]|nr:dTMP kinase [Purpureocillium takamizusanense]UNI19446.1 dTMP kinase [Purpureocillium takamizusanense]